MNTIGRVEFKGQIGLFKRLSAIVKEIMNNCKKRKDLTKQLMFIASIIII